jgi:release factor glutamine methyltransferase
MKNRMDLYLNFEKPLTPAELDVLRTMVARRATREPLQHIIGDTSFRGFIIKCDRRALIPRPETESLVDMAADCLKGIEKPFIVEIGTGTGAISIACAKEIAGAKVLATDVSEDALALARTNAEANDLAGNPDAESAASSTDSTASASSASSANAASTLTFAQGDLLNAITADVIANVAGDATAKIDCLIANLPYIPDSEKDKLQPEVAKYDPALALFGGADGLDLVRKLLQQTEGKLKPGASILLEIGSEQGEMLKAEAEKYPWLEFTGIHKDFCNNVRFVSYKAK